MNKSIKKPALALLFLAFVGMALPGCFRQYEYAKTITNNMEYPIEVAFLCCGGVEQKAFTIEPGEVKVIHECIYEGLGKVPNCGNSPLDIEVTGAAGQLLEVDIDQPAAWEYFQEDKSIVCNFNIENNSVATKNDN